MKKNSRYLTRRKFLEYMAAAAAPVAVGMISRVQGVETQNFASLQVTAKIPSTGEEIPRVGLGTYSTFDVGSGSEEIQQVKDVLAAFYAAGGRLVDSSPMYGNAETVTGSVSADLGINAALFMATKVWISGREAGMGQMAESLQKLRRKKLELMQIHNLIDWRTQLKTLREYKDRGIYRYIGITHYMTSAFPEIEKIIRSEKLDFLQIPYSIAETTAAARLIPAAAEKGLAVIANEPFAQGRIFSRVRGKAVPAWAVEKGITTWAQYFLKFILSENRVQFIIPATRKLAHLKDNMAAGQGYLPNLKERTLMQKDF